MNNERSSTANSTSPTTSISVSGITDVNQPNRGRNADETPVQFVHRSFVKNKAVPTNGKDVKLVVTEGTITLRGVVKSERERISIGALARQFSGSRQVDNQLEVANTIEEAIDRRKKSGFV